MVSLTQFPRKAVTDIHHQDNNMILTPIHVNRDIGISANSGCGRDEGISLYLTVDDKLIVKLSNICYSEGPLEALKLLVDPRNGSQNKKLVYIASSILKVIDSLTKIRYMFQPHLKDLGPKLTALYSHTKDWSNSPIRYLCWHYYTSKLAVVTADDNVRIYSSESQLTPTLKCSYQKGVSMVAWRPYSASEIAVGCEIGAILWTVDPNSIFTKPSSNNATVLKQSGHGPVTSLAWSPDGEILVTASAADCSLLVWGSLGEKPCALRRVAGGAASHIAFAPDGSKLFSATTGIIFRVWETNVWQAERWSVRGGRVQAACWSPCSQVLLFATEDETLIYALKFANASLFAAERNAPGVATPVIDLSMVELEDGEVAGGRVLDMQWSPRGHHLAITFKESSFIAIFNTSIQNILHITPYCLLSGTGIEVPSAIAFQQKFEEGALLTVGWSSGRVQHVPIVYSVPSLQSSY